MNDNTLIPTLILSPMRQAAVSVLAIKAKPPSQAV